MKQKGFARSVRLRFATFVIFVVVIVFARFAVGIIVEPSAGDISSTNSSAVLAERTTTVNTTLVETREKLADPRQAPLENYLQTLANIEGHISVYVRDLDNNFLAEINGNDTYRSASLYKTLAAFRVMQRIEQGEIASTREIDHCIELAIEVSDNPCGMLLQSLSDPYHTDSMLKEMGYSESNMSGVYPTTSARDQFILFNSIYMQDGIGQASSDVLLNHLARQQVLNRTPVYEDATLYLKTGDLGSEIHSSAIVEGANGTTYFISVLSDDWSASTNERYAIIEGIHRRVHEIIMN